MEISHLLFTYDTIFLCEPYLPQLTYMAWVLSWFEAFSKLKINLNKRELILLGEFPIVEEQASILGYGVGKLSTTQAYPWVLPSRLQLNEMWYKRGSPKAQLYGKGTYLTVDGRAGPFSLTNFIK